MVEALEALKEDLAAIKPNKKKEIKEIKANIQSLEEEIEVHTLCSFLCFSVHVSLNVVVPWICHRLSTDTVHWKSDKQNWWN